ncbi:MULTISPECIES: sulfatase [Haloferax]|uniref:Sulfatase n=1 Tax=Haloferax gibbonsii TaxID=35746 RepID=A0A0K1ITD5_HALGI|nr:MULTISPECIES: sulfatase [Haloferax]AKU07578.1 sulfatase [Haloferax gibbonsii]REA04901.1 sulfatase [Haloferax sp. Atlit-6N]
MNTVLITVDALRAGHVGQYGYQRDTLPVLDRLLDDDSTLFTAAFANGTNTGISVPSLLTSRYRGDEHARDGPNIASPLPDEVSTAGIHSNTYFASRVPRPADFDHFDDFGIMDSEDSGSPSAAHRLFRRTMDLVRPTVESLGIRPLAERIQEAVFPASLIMEQTVYENAEKTTDRALEWLDGVDGDFFLWVHYMDPHRPYGIDLEDPAYAEPADESEIRRLMSKAGIHPEDVTEAERRRIVDLYDSDIRYTSDHIDRFLDGLQSLGRYDETDIILTADHGEEFADHGNYYHRNRPYDELTHVPLVVKSDRGDGGVVDDQRELLDLAPTVARNHGVEPPSAFRGTDLFEGGPRRVVSTGSFSDAGPVVGVREDGWKYIAVDGEEDELYDLRADPKERENVAADHPDRCASFRSEIPPHLLRETTEGVPEADDVSEDVQKRLEELGYMD